MASGGHVIANSVPANWHIAGVGDFDGNGKSDILWRDDTGAVAIWDNGQNSAGHVVGTVSTDWHIV